MAIDTVATVCRAIEERRLLLFNYNGRSRLAYPCAHGWLSTGNEALRAHEVAFVGSQRRVGSGKLFLLASMHLVELADETFDRPPRGYQADDRGMASIHCQL